MYFYNSLLLISNILMLTVQTQTQAAKGIGNAGCFYYNFVSKHCENIPSVQISEIPDECTSIVVSAAEVNLKYEIAAVHNDPENNKMYLDNLKEVLKFSKPVYLFYGYASIAAWAHVFASNGGDNPLYEMESLKKFMEQYSGIAGVILNSLENYGEPIELEGFSENLKKYIEVLKTTFPELEIGIQFQGRFLIDQYTDSKLPWLDIKVIQPCTDFFVIAVSDLNDCTDESLRNSGGAPMTSSITDYTMENIKGILPQLSIPKEKLHFKYKMNPLSDPNASIEFCDLTIQQMCDHPSDTSLYCSDTMQSFYEKGQFVRENGAGFIVTNIEMNDPENKCKCEKPFGSFYAILKGFEGGDKPCCELFPRK